MATVHLICGSTGAGRTTYAIALADRVKGVRFSSDEWMAALFLGDQPVHPSVTWAVERMARCEAQMWVVAEQLIARRMDAVFDVGLSKREHRDRFRTRAAQVGAESKLHYLDVDVETRRERVRRRNVEAGGARSDLAGLTGSAGLAGPARAPLVTDAMFDWLERWFEAPDDDELYGAMIVCS